MVALFLSTLAVALVKPQYFTEAPMIMKIVVLTLFIAGTIHLVGRIREGLQRYTYYDDEIHESILDDTEVPHKPHSRLLAAGFLIVGLIVSFAAGLIIGQYSDVSFIPKVHNIAQALKPEYLFYPPIFVLIVDLMHTAALRTEGS
jgi:hypothetical protein